MTVQTEDAGKMRRAQDRGELEKEAAIAHLMLGEED